MSDFPNGYTPTTHTGDSMPVNRFTLYDDSKYENHSVNELPLDNPMNNDIWKASKIYRDYRDSCGYKDPVALDEIEEAYYEGAEWQKKLLLDKACKWLYEQLFEGTMECKNIEALITDFKIKMEE